MTKFDEYCKDKGGRQIGLNADWCVSVYNFGEAKRRDLVVYFEGVHEPLEALLVDYEDGAFGAILWNEKAYKRVFLDDDNTHDPVLAGTYVCQVCTTVEQAYHWVKVWNGND